MDFLTEEERACASVVINSIRLFEDGDDSFYYDVCAIIKVLKKSTYRMYETYIKTKIYIGYLKIKSSIYGVMRDDISDLYSSCDKYVEYYKECLDTLLKYMSIGKKTGNYPDLEAAYTLSIALSGILFNINDYIREISNIIKSYNLNYFYSGNPNLNLVCEKRKSNVTTLINTLKINNDSYDKLKTS